MASKRKRRHEEDIIKKEGGVMTLSMKDAAESFYRGTPIISNIRQLDFVPTVDQNEDVYELIPMYQNGKLVAYRKRTLLSRDKCGGVWGPEKDRTWEDPIEYFVQE